MSLVQGSESLLGKNEEVMEKVYSNMLEEEMQSLAIDTVSLLA